MPAEIQCLPQQHQSLWLLSSPQSGAHSTTAHAQLVLFRTVAQAPALAHMQGDRSCNAHVASVPVLGPLQCSPRTNGHGTDACPSPLQCCSINCTEAKDMPFSACCSHTPRVLPPAPSTHQAQDLLHLPQESQHFLGLTPIRWSLQAHLTLCRVMCRA